MQKKPPGGKSISLFAFDSSIDWRMRLCHPPDGSTSPKYKLLCFITTKFFCKDKNALAFNRDRCCHLVLCLRLIPFHCWKHWFQHLLCLFQKFFFPSCPKRQLTTACGSCVILMLLLLLVSNNLRNDIFFYLKSWKVYLDFMLLNRLKLINWADRMPNNNKFVEISIDSERKRDIIIQIFIQMAQLHVRFKRPLSH